MNLTNDQINSLAARASSLRSAAGAQPATAAPDAGLSLFSAATKAHPDKYHIYAEGDSWFAYPRQWILFGADSNIIQCLNERDDLIILNKANNGDEAEQMLSGTEKLEMFQALNTQRFDVLLFSGGGNDIVGAYDFDFFLKDWEAGFAKAEDCIHLDRFMRRLNRIEDAYTDMVELALVFSTPNPGIQIVTHVYDWALPDPRGASFLGGVFQYDGGKSWMYPYFKAKGYYGADANNPLAAAVVKYMLSEFAARLRDVQAAYPETFHVVETQGLLNPDEWLNEIHPTPAGFKKVADLIYDKIVEVVPPTPAS